MMLRKSILSVVLTIAMLMPLAQAVTVKAADDTKQIDVLFTHDTHSHLDSFSTIVNGEQKEVGGFAKIKTLINEKKKEDPDTLILDGGDFSMGTLIQTVYDTEAAELRMLGYLGYDVTTFGNHEFDYRSQGLANMLKAAKSSGETLPEIVVCNVDWDSMEKAGLNDGQKQIQSAFETYGVKDYVMVQKGDVKIAVVGVFGKDALECAPTCELSFKDPVEAVKKTVEEIKKNEEADMIACVSHGGTWEDESKSEDELLAKAVPDLDLIISGHTHSELQEAIQHGNTYIVSCGEYGRNLGSLSMTQNSDGRWDLSAYELIPVSEDVKADKATQERIDALMDTVDTNYLADFGYTRKEVLAQNDVEFNSLEEMGTEHKELNLGDIMADAYVYAVENSEYYDGDPVDVAVVPSGTVRDTYTKGDITVEDVYNSFSLGIGKDGVAGYPLINAYLTGKELKLVAEVDASISDFMTTARLYCSGLNFTYNPHRMILNKVTDCYLTRADGERTEIEDDKLYHVVTDLYTGQMLGSVMKMSYGLLSLEPKDKDGNPIENLEDHAVMEGDKELKAWDAIARYMQSFDDADGDGIANVSEYYATTHDRKVVDDSKNILDLVKKPNKFTAIIVCIGLIIIIIIVLVVSLIRKIVRKSRKKKNIHNTNR
ncbi:bifunctional metallophosphatase/5'-nucleotidase [Blautia obeum]|uniref:Bifunctional metallophosphatase/5'-nucleotidase n=1 Tax=Blautia obeum TaxID=40520 RepID=A0A411ZNZ4_9FIRM|nr:bifunctional UDP-sugar hydrolase/5'-nucleotidase [Blautia obeum]RGI91117.1 bifunctional metallophosphatase/5'-nucleotidase [Blautia obeum]RGQ04534.1 bifunctional metallophosphatase/5'-nucleotidase [Blautia obeum]RHK94262.1 bifunctional metallophosphatase/5'-nucleotidase [Blautia obeum]